jgi:acetolactate synthase-1/2/3 large subunit
VKGFLSMGEVADTLYQCLPEPTAHFIDSGEHRLFAGHFYGAHHHLGFLSAGKMAPMGWAIAAGIGGGLLRPDYPVCVLTGDGCALMHGLEMAPAARYRAPVLFVVTNNGSYGRVAARFKQAGGENSKRLTQLPKVNWLSFGQSLGLESVRAESVETLQNAIAHFLNRNGPMLIEAMVLEHNELPFPEASYSSCSQAFLQKYTQNYHYDS